MDYQRYRRCSSCNAQMDVLAYGNCNTCRQVEAIRKINDRSNDFSSRMGVPYDRSSPIGLPPGYRRTLTPEEIAAGYTIGLPPTPRKIMTQEEFEKWSAEMCEKSFREEARKEKKKKLTIAMTVFGAIVLFLLYLAR